ncbi:MAG: cytochrome C [bacterium]
MMKKFLAEILTVCYVLFSFLVFSQESEHEARPDFPLINYKMKAERNTTPSVDHSKFPVLKKEFTNAHEVTAACLSCHTNRGNEVMATSHWLWQREEEIPGKGKVWLGKRNVLNNFCIGTRSNEGTCTRCHIGYGWQDKNFDFTDPLNIDCLVCHDQTDHYRKEKGGAGYPKAEVDLNDVARHVGKPGKANCGVCHFWGGGGNNVKHGDLEIALLDCNKKVTILNVHGNRIACQTCHIPVYAKVNGTKMIWDWSTAGRLDEDGHPMHENDADGNHNYLSIKGNFVFNDHAIPEYYWFNGKAGHYLIEDQIDTVPLQMNTLYGSYLDRGQQGGAGSKIWPVKVHRGRQPYDTEYNRLIQVKTWDKDPGSGAYWTDFDWQTANALGMEYVGLPYSGHFDFIETEMYWPLNHMVSPAEESLKCIDCHTRDSKGRLAQLTDFYLPGRDVNMGVETAGVSFILAALIGVGFHAFCRLVFGGKCITNLGKEEE